MNLIFANYLLKNPLENLQRETSATTVKHLSHNDIEDLELRLPPLPEQTAIADILSDMDEEIEKLTRKLDKYKAIKQGMMQELLTGKVRLM